MCWIVAQTLGLTWQRKHKHRQVRAFDFLALSPVVTSKILSVIQSDGDPYWIWQLWQLFQSSGCRKIYFGVGFSFFVFDLCLLSIAIHLRANILKAMVPKECVMTSSPVPQEEIVHRESLTIKVSRHTYPKSFICLFKMCYNSVGIHSCADSLM